MSAERSDRNGRPWTSCPLLRIRRHRANRTWPVLRAGHTLGTYQKDGGVCEHPCMMFGGLHAGSWEILIIPVVMMLLFAVILVRMYHGGHR